MTIKANTCIPSILRNYTHDSHSIFLSLPFKLIAATTRQCGPSAPMWRIWVRLDDTIDSHFLGSWLGWDLNPVLLGTVSVVCMCVGYVCLWGVWCACASMMCVIRVCGVHVYGGYGWVYMCVYVHVEAYNSCSPWLLSLCWVRVSWWTQTHWLQLD